MKVSVIKCDGCQREKQQSNHWYVLEVGKPVKLWHWDETVAGEHFCGTGCLFKRLAQWAE